MRWILCLLLVSMWWIGQFTGFSIADQPHLPLLAAAGLVLTRQRHAESPRRAGAAPRAALTDPPVHVSPALGR